MINNPSDIMELYRVDFLSFAEFAFLELNPGADYLDNWHLDILADRLSQCVIGSIQKLMVNLPPRNFKSHFASAALPAWILGNDPAASILCISSNSVLAGELEEKTRRLMNTPRYRALFPHVRMMPTKRDICLEEGGSRRACSISDDIMGRGADYIIIDDPLKANAVHDAKLRGKANDWYDANVHQRLNNKSKAAIIVVMQRLHENDLCGHLIGKGDEWTLLSLPAIAQRDETWQTQHGFRYSRKKGEALHPDRESLDILRECLLSTGAVNFAWQYLQGTFHIGCGPEGTRAEYINAPEDSGWDPGFYLILEEHYILERVFGDPSLYPPNVTYTEEEWERDLMKQQSKLKGEIRQDMLARS